MRPEDLAYSIEDGVSSSWPSRLAISLPEAELRKRAQTVPAIGEAHTLMYGADRANLAGFGKLFGTRFLVCAGDADGSPPASRSTNLDILRKPEIPQRGLDRLDLGLDRRIARRGPRNGPPASALVSQQVATAPSCKSSSTSEEGRSPSTSFPVWEVEAVGAAASPGREPRPWRRGIPPWLRLGNCQALGRESAHCVDGSPRGRPGYRGAGEGPAVLVGAQG